MRRLRKPPKKYIANKRGRLLILKNHPFIVPVSTLLALLIITFVLYLNLGSPTLVPTDSHIAIVSYDKQQQTIPTKAPNVGELLKRLNIKLYEGDIVEPTAETPIVEDNFRVNVYRARPVIIVDGGHKTLAYSAATTPRSISQQAGITVYPEDNLVKTLPDSFLRSNAIGEEVIIERSVPIYLNLYGASLPVRTHAKTVKALLDDKKVTLAEGETVQPELNATLQPNQAVFVNKKDIRVETVTEDISPATQTIEDNSLSFGTTVVRQQGASGKRIIVYQINIVNGSKNKLQEVIIQQPVPKIVARGKSINIAGDKSGLMASAGIASSDYAYVNYIISHENAMWCPTRWQGQNYCPAYFEETHSINSGSGYGLCQSTPAGKMSSAGADWRTNAVTQLKWCSGYAVGRYGSWEAAYNTWQARGWW